MKLDAMTVGAIGFAAFAAFTVLKKKPTTTTSAGAAFDMAAAQRREVGANLYQNDLYFSENLDLAKWGAPASGFWFL